MAVSGGGGRCLSTSGTIGCPGGTQGLHKASTASSALHEFRLLSQWDAMLSSGAKPRRVIRPGSTRKLGDLKAGS